MTGPFVGHSSRFAGSGGPNAPPPNAHAAEWDREARAREGKHRGILDIPISELESMGPVARYLLIERERANRIAETVIRRLKDGEVCRVATRAPIGECPPFSGPVIQRAGAVAILKPATQIAHGDTLRDRARSAPTSDPLSVLAPGGLGRPPGRRGYYKIAVLWVAECYERTPALARQAASEVERKARERLSKVDGHNLADHATAQVIGPPRRRSRSETGGNRE